MNRAVINVRPSRLWVILTSSVKLVYLASLRLCEGSRTRTSPYFQEHDRGQLGVRVYLYMVDGLYPPTKHVRLPKCELKTEYGVL